MRLKKLILWEMKCQRKYGFYLLYAILTVIYLVVLYTLPDAWSQKAAALLIFSDPAAMGLFFMGAILLLESSQRVPYALAVSPIKASEYILAKIISLGIISLVVALLLALPGYIRSRQLNGLSLLLLLLGTAFASAMFTLLGIIIGTKITSLNQFLIATVPMEVIGFVPGILHLFHMTPDGMRYYPPSFCMDLISGRLGTELFSNAAALPFARLHAGVALFVTLAAIAGLFVWARNCVLRQLNRCPIQDKERKLTGNAK